MGGGKRTRERALPKIFGPLQKSFWSALSWISVQENRAPTPEGGGKRTVRGGVQNPFLEGVSFVRFSTPLPFPPPMASSELRKLPVLLRADFVLPKDPRPLYYKTPPCLFCHKNALRKAILGSLVRTPSVLRKAGNFLRKAEGVGVGAFAPLPSKAL